MRKIPVLTEKDEPELNIEECFSKKSIKRKIRTMTSFSERCYSNSSIERTKPDHMMTKDDQNHTSSSSSHAHARNSNSSSNQHQVSRNDQFQSKSFSHNNSNPVNKNLSHVKKRNMNNSMHSESGIDSQNTNSSYNVRNVSNNMAQQKLDMGVGPIASTQSIPSEFIGCFFWGDFGSKQNFFSIQNPPQKNNQ